MSNLIIMQTIFGITTMVIGLMFGYKWINYLRVNKMGQNVLELAPETHIAKQGTPTMGALIIIVPVVITMTMYAAIFKNVANFAYLGILLVTMVGFALIGFFDDSKKIAKKQNEGLSAIQKLIFQIFVAVLVVFLMERAEMLSHSFFMPMLNHTIYVKDIFYYLILIVLIVGYSNATNITDGVDGLLGTTSIIVFMFFFLATATSSYYFDLQMFSLAMIGGLLAFLFFNKYPAKVFMGDTGSLMIGALMVVLAIMTNLIMPFLIISLLYLFETGSVFLQVSYFKFTKKRTGVGKRIFPMTPIHHSFEKAGWSENKVVLYFSLFTALLCIFTLIGINI